MSMKVEFPEPKVRAPSKGTAGLQTHIGGVCSTVSAIKEASKAIGNESLVKKSIG